MTDDPHLLLGAYVLGGLSAADRATFEDHLAGCSRCRSELVESAGLPALLRQVRPRDAGETPVAPLAATAHRRTRRRRPRRILVASAAVVALGAATVFGVILVGPATPTLRFAADSSSGVHGTAGLRARPWGTEIHLDIAGLPRHGVFALEVRARDGRTEPAATWAGAAPTALQVIGATSVPPDDIAALEVLGAGSSRALATAENGD